MKKGRKFTWSWSTEKSSCANGFISSIALICFALLLQLMAYAAIYLQESAMLLKASERSQADLFLITEAREMAEHNIYARKCMPESIIEEKTVHVLDEEAFLQDFETYIRVSCQNVRMKVYYDQTGLINIEWSTY